MYIYASEIWPSEVRAVGVAVSISGQWIASILFLQSAPTAFANIGYRFYIVFIVCTVVFGFIVYFWFPEVSHVLVFYDNRVALVLTAEADKRFVIGGNIWRLW